jgi:hypothetical protein
VKADTPPAEVHLWTAVSKTKDFRSAKWSSAEVRGEGDGLYLCRATVPKGKVLALYAALTYKTEKGEAYKLCTNAAVFPP